MSAEESQSGCPTSGCHGRLGRRRMISSAGVGWLALAGGTGLSGLATVRFMFPNASEEPDPRISVGPVDLYIRMPAGTVDERRKRDGVWLVRLSDRLVAMSTACTHLGCILDWLPGERKFKCPCHGSGFTLEGINSEGPAPRPMDRFGIGVEDGLVVIDRSRRFLGAREERGSHLLL